MDGKYQTPQPNDEKLKELIIYLANKCQGDDAFGAVKINKLLFYADFLAYLNFGHAITGHEYQVLNNGPAPRRFLPIRRQLEEQDDIIVYQKDIGASKPQTIIAPKRQANLGVFTAQEIALVDMLIEDNRYSNGTYMSRESHRFVGWQLGQIGETIPYEVALVSKREPTPYEINYGLQLEELADECLST
jgi:hypothetical protein